MVYRAEEEARSLRKHKPGYWGQASALLLAATAGAEPVDPAHHWPLPPAVLEERLSTEDFEVLEVTGGVGGVTGAKKLRIRMAEDNHEIAVKWKPAPPGDADGWNNAPRKEIAAYEIQKWFLEPGDYVVPTIVARCLHTDHHDPIETARAPTIEDTQCVLGALVIWIDAVSVPDDLYDSGRFRNEPLYARHLADFNLLTYLIDHDDGRKGNFLVSEHEQQRRIFSVDNGVTFGTRLKNFLVPNWDRIRVPALRKQSIERLREVTDEHYEALGVLVEMQADHTGVLKPVAPGKNTDPKKGARVQPGSIQFGLEKDEIEAIRRRIDRILGQVDSGKIPTF
ncbi:MAG: hypothetical protein CL938_16965 [Deltaproteobacteria bacterium]|jgi:hypothetical protein|nr:hypothetical protein [Deltaproteobacteria bacterium]